LKEQDGKQHLAVILLGRGKQQFVLSRTFSFSKKMRLLMLS
jgi:hypothetical protein